MYEILEVINLKEFAGEWSANDLWQDLEQNQLWFNNSGEPYAKSIINDHLNVLTLLGILNWDTNTKNPMKFRENKFIEVLLRSNLWKKEIFEIMQFNAVKIPWIRELLFAFNLHPNKNNKTIFSILENTQPGFDIESLKFSLKLSRDLNLIDKNNQLNNEISKFLWHKMELVKK